MSTRTRAQRARGRPWSEGAGEASSMCFSKEVKGTIAAASYNTLTPFRRETSTGSARNLVPPKDNGKRSKCRPYTKRSTARGTTTKPANQASWSIPAMMPSISGLTTGKETQHEVHSHQQYQLSNTNVAVHLDEAGRDAEHPGPNDASHGFPEGELPRFRKEASILRTETFGSHSPKKNTTHSRKGALTTARPLLVNACLIGETCAKNFADTCYTASGLRAETHLHPTKCNKEAE